MGNRAVIRFESQPEIGIYLHWNGGVESVLAFLQATRETVGDKREPALAVLHTITNFFTYDGLNVYIGAPNTLDEDNGDNGVYHVDSNLNLVRRSHVPARLAGAVALEFDDLDEPGKDYCNGVLRECLENRLALEELKRSRNETDEPAAAGEIGWARVEMARRRQVRKASR